MGWCVQEIETVAGGEVCVFLKGSEGGVVGLLAGADKEVGATEDLPTDGQRKQLEDLDVIALRQPAADLIEQPAEGVCIGDVVGKAEVNIRERAGLAGTLGTEEDDGLELLVMRKLAQEGEDFLF